MQEIAQHLLIRIAFFVSANKAANINSEHALRILKDLYTERLRERTSKPCAGSLCGPTKLMVAQRDNYHSIMIKY